MMRAGASIECHPPRDAAVATAALRVLVGTNNVIFLRARTHMYSQAKAAAAANSKNVEIEMATR